MCPCPSRIIQESESARNDSCVLRFREYGVEYDLCFAEHRLCRTAVRGSSGSVRTWGHHLATSNSSDAEEWAGATFRLQYKSQGSAVRPRDVHVNDKCASRFGAESTERTPTALNPLRNFSLTVVPFYIFKAVIHGLMQVLRSSCYHPVAVENYPVRIKCNYMTIVTMQRTRSWNAG